MAPTRDSLQQRMDALIAVQNTPEEQRLLHTAVGSMQEYVTASAGLSTVFHIDLADGTEAFLKPLGRRLVNGVLEWWVSSTSCGLYEHHPVEAILNEATAWQLAKRLGGPVAQVATPAVLRNFPAQRVSGVVTARRYGISHNARAIGRAPEQAMAAAFFDALIAQQDRHGGNFRWNEPDWLYRLPARLGALIRSTMAGAPQWPLGLGLIDHGFCFAKPKQFCRPDKRSVFVEWRHDTGRASLTDWERQALHDLLADADAYGLFSFLEPDNARAVVDRARKMYNQRSVLGPAEW